MAPHILDGNQCTVCKVWWTFLTERDRIMLQTQGDCIGQEERWRSCKLNKGMLCLGVKEGHRGVCTLPDVAISQHRAMSGYRNTEHHGQHYDCGACGTACW